MDFINKYDKYIDDNGNELDFINDDQIGGTLEKSFCRCSTNLFLDFVNEIKNNPNTSYITYINDLIKSGYTPKWISALQKEVDHGFYCEESYSMSEVIGSRLANIFEVPTVYNVIHEDSVYSIDFISNDEKFITFQELTENDLDCRTPINNWLDFILNSINDKYSIKCNDEFIEKFIYSYIVRNLIFRDRDFKSKNLGLLFDENLNSIKFAPNFDFEFIGKSTNSPIILYKQIHNNISYLVSRYPYITQKIMKKLARISAENTKHHTVSNTLQKHINNVSDINILDNMISENLKTVLSIYHINKRNNKSRGYDYEK